MELYISKHQKWIKQRSVLLMKVEVANSKKLRKGYLGFGKVIRNCPDADRRNYSRNIYYDGMCGIWSETAFDRLKVENVYIKNCNYVHGRCEDLFRVSSIFFIDWFKKKFFKKRIIVSVKNYIQSVCNFNPKNKTYIGIISETNEELNVIIDKKLYSFDLSQVYAKYTLKFDVFNSNEEVTFKDFVEKLSRSKVKKGLWIKQIF